jgi:site-specific recombinase XerD
METTTPRTLNGFQANVGNRDLNLFPVVPPAPKPKLLDQVRQAIRTRHYSPRTEETYVHWIKRFIFFHNKRHPSDMAEPEIARFLSNLATESHVSASTQNQALNAVLFLYRQFLRKDIGYVNGVVRANRPKRLPTVLTRQEVRSIFENLDGSEWIMAMMLYGAGPSTDGMPAAQGQGRRLFQ